MILGMEIKAHRGLTGSQLYWVGLGCLGLAVAAFAGSFAMGNSLDPQGAVFVLVIGLVISVIASIIAAVLSIAGLVAFPAQREIHHSIGTVAGVLAPALAWVDGHRALVIHRSVHNPCTSSHGVFHTLSTGFPQPVDSVCR